MNKKTDNLFLCDADSNACRMCKELLTNLDQFFEMLGAARKLPASDWLTVDDIAKELRISKSIVYRLIRNGEIEAINIVENNGKIAQRGHYRIKRANLNQYIKSKKVSPPQKNISSKPRLQHFPKVKNHLGL